MGGRLQACVVLVAGALIGGLAGPSTAGAAGHAITVTPSTGLIDGQTLAVAGTRFTETPSVNGWSVTECRAQILDQPITLLTALANCDVTTQPFVFAHADPAGNLSTSYTARTTFGASATVDCTTTPCVVLVSQIVDGGAGFVGAGAPITFGGPPPPSPPPLDVDPELRVHHHHARVEVTCSPATANRCLALLAVRSGGSIVGGVFVDLEPGDHRWLPISGPRMSWYHLARLGLTYQVWGGPDTASSTGPLTLRD